MEPILWEQHGKTNENRTCCNKAWMNEKGPSQLDQTCPTLGFHFLKVNSNTLTPRRFRSTDALLASALRSTRRGFKKYYYITEQIPY
jgi:hypothetical protein